MTVDAGFGEFVQVNYADLIRTGYRLTGSAQAAEDLVQASLLRTMRAWRRIDDPLTYVRRTMADLHRRRWRRHRAGTLAQTQAASHPLGRLLDRRRRRNWLLASSVTAVIAAVVAGVVVIGLPTGRPAAAAPDWVNQLLLSPPRGTVAQQPGFVADLTTALTAQNKAGASNPVLDGQIDSVPVAQKEVRVLLVEDVDTVRVALVALVPPAAGGDHVLVGTMLAWLVAPRGASPAALVRAAQADNPPADTQLQAQNLEPFATVDLMPATAMSPTGSVAIGVAPPGCVVAAAGLPAVTDWRAEPTGSFILRGPAQRRAEWWRVSCDGVVRYERPAPVIADPDNPDTSQVTDAMLRAALAQAGGAPDPALTKMTMQTLRVIIGFGLTAPPMVVWGGRAALPGARPAPDAPDRPAAPATVVIVAAPQVDGGWVGQVDAHFDDGQPDTSYGLGGFGWPTDPRLGLFATRIRAPYVRADGGQVFADSHLVLAVAPPGATTIRSVYNGQTVDQVAVTGGAAVVSTGDVGAAGDPDADPDADEVTIEALDAAGAVLATVTPAGPDLVIGSRPTTPWPR